MCAVTLVLPGILLERQYKPMVTGESKGVCKYRSISEHCGFSPASLQFRIFLGPHRNNLQRLAQTPWSLLGSDNFFFFFLCIQNSEVDMVLICETEDQINLKNVYFGVEGMQAYNSADILYTNVLKGWKKSPYLLISDKSLLKTCQWHRNFFAENYFLIFVVF